MVLAVHCQLNPQTRSFVPTAMALTLEYRRGKREEEEESVSMHQICSGNGIWAGGHGVGRLNPRCETKSKDKKGTEEGGEHSCRVTEAARQCRAAPRATERNKESIKFA